VRPHSHALADHEAEAGHRQGVRHPLQAEQRMRETTAPLPKARKLLPPPDAVLPVHSLHHSQTRPPL
jgi:hypothetical protein